MVRARELTSTQNPMVKLMRSLYTRKGRDKTGLVPVEGIRFVNEALLAAQRGVTAIEALFYEAGFDEKGPEQRALIEAAGAAASQVFCCPPALFRALTDTESPQGVAAAVTRPAFPPREASGRELYLVIDRVQDPGNLGTMVRTAAAAGVHGVLCLKGTADPFNSKALRATMGAVFRIPISFYDSTQHLLEKLSPWGCRLIAADVEGPQYHFQADYSGCVAIVVGNEGQGIDPRLLSAATDRVRIPLAGDVESLNAAVACGIMLYEAVRFRHMGAECK
ncbi:MAG: RNA methyltransferase [Firmicutes bacterium]|jgi:TrmH family RNA methyltransferase|nr:RNA methyltransferase [Bacillota bacterium]